MRESTAMTTTLMGSYAQDAPVDATADDELTALIRAAQVDLVTFGPLYQRFVDRVYSYLRARTNDADDAHDLTQQVFVHAMDALPRFRGQGNAFPAWLFRIARNMASNARSRRRPTVALHLLPEGHQPLADGDPEGGAISQESAVHLRILLDILPSDKRELVTLRFAAGLTIPEIAAVIGKSEAATRKQLNRTLHSLQEHYHALY